MRVSIRLLGGFAVDIEGTEPDLAGLPRRSRELVQLIALSPGHHLSRDRVTEHLFGHLGPEAAAANLHKAASLARHHLGTTTSVTIRAGLVSLWPEHTVEVDAARFENEADAALRSGAADRCQDALRLYRGDLLPYALSEEWAIEPRRHLRALFVELLRAAGEWQRLIEVEPTSEEAAGHLMRLSAEQGDTAGVVNRFKSLEAAMARELSLQPSSGTTALYQELTRGPALVAPVAARSPLIGRKQLLSAMTEVMDTTEGGGGGGLLVSGEPGIGKTRLGEELLMRAIDHGWSTLRGTASRVEAGIPFLPVAEATDRLAAARPDLLDRLPPPAQAALARVTVAGLSVAEPTPAQLGPQHVVSAVARLIAAAARERPVMLFFDDMHAADVDTVRLVHHLMRSAIFQRVLVVAAFHTAEESEPVAEMRTELLGSGRVTQVVVPPLETDEAAELLATRTGRSLEGARARILWERAAGNPFLLEELAAWPDQDRIPTSVTAAMSARLARADPDTRALLETAAVVGDSFPSAELAALAGIGPDRFSVVLDDPSIAELIDQTGDRLRFRHPLLQQAILEGLPQHRVTAAHRSAARTAEESGAAPARVAHHLLAAGLSAEAGPWLVTAARDAASIGAFADATALLDRTLSNGVREPGVLRFRADLAYATADPEAPRRYTEAIAASSSIEAASLLIRRAAAYVAANQPGPAADSLAAVRAPEDDDLPLLDLTRSQVAWMAGDLDSALEQAEGARRCALSRGQMDVVMGAVSMIDLIMHQRGDWEDRFRHDLIGAEDSPSFATFLYDAHLCGAEIYLYGGRPHAELSQFARDLAERARRGGARRGLAFAETLLGEIALLSGDLDTAEAHLVVGMELHHQIESPGGEALGRQRLAQVLLARGSKSEVMDLLSEALTLAGSAGALAWHLVARVYATMIDAAPGADAALTLVDLAEADIGGGMAKACPSCSVPYWLAAAKACADGGRISQAKRFAATASPRVAAVWPKGGWEAALDEAYCRVALAEGDLDGARALLERAATGFERVGQRLDHDRCRAALTHLAP